MALHIGIKFWIFQIDSKKLLFRFLYLLNENLIKQRKWSLGLFMDRKNFPQFTIQIRHKIDPSRVDVYFLPRIYLCDFSSSNWSFLWRIFKDLITITRTIVDDLMSFPHRFLDQSRLWPFYNMTGQNIWTEKNIRYAKNADKLW